MALQSSGAISLSNIQTEFGGSNPISMSEYYRGGSFTTNNNTNVPTSGSISFSNFYGGTSEFTFSITSTTENANLRTLALAAGWGGSEPLICNISSGIYLWSDTTSSAGLIISGSFAGGLTVNNSGYIMGKGGAGGNRGATSPDDGYAGSPGGPAISNASSNVTIVNNSGAYIAGGGGGGGAANGGYPVSVGGGGAGGGPHGGAGSASYTYGGNPAPGSASSSFIYSDGNTTGDTTAPGAQAGGRGAPHKYDDGLGGSQLQAQTGGRVLPGTGTTGGSYTYNGNSENPKGLSFVGGGAAGVAGTNATVTGQGAGGGGWGAAGGTGKNGRAGGAGGAAISGTAVSLTNNGTIYGTTST